MEPVTIEDVLRLIKASEEAAARRAAEADRRAAAAAARRDEEARRRGEEARRRDEEARRRDEEARRRDEEARRRDEEARRRGEELDRRLAETNATIDRMTADGKETQRRIDSLTGKWGRFVESQVVPACRTLFIDRGIAVHEVYERARSDRGGKSMEIDILVVNDDDAVLVEVKSTLGVDDVRSHLAHIAGFREMFPTYRHHTLYGALAGIVVPDQVGRFVINQGLFLIKPSGDTVAIANPPAFQPRAW